MKLNYLIPLLLFPILFACENEGIQKDPALQDKSSVNIRLTDAPADYEEVWIDIQGIEFHLTTKNGDGKWISLENVNKGLYNLLDYSNGKDTLLVSTDLDSGVVSQIRLILGEQNCVVTDKGKFILKVPSGSTSGLKINLHEAFDIDVIKNIWIDFDASKSIVKTGNGKYILKPVLRAYTKIVGGAIKGHVNPKESLPSIYAIMGTDTLSTIADTSGYFFIGGVPIGVYSVKFDPIEPFLDTIIEGVQVSSGIETDLDTVLISQ